MWDNIVFQDTFVCINYSIKLDKIDVCFFNVNYDNLIDVKYSDFKECKAFGCIKGEDYKVTIKKIDNQRMLENVKGF